MATKRPPKSITTAEICRQLNLGLTVARLKGLGFTPMFEHKTAAFWDASILRHIIERLSIELQIKAEGMLKDEYQQAMASIQ